MMSVHNVAWWRMAVVALCAAWWLQKLPWTTAERQWDFNVYYYGAQAWRAGLDPYAPTSLPRTLSDGGFKFNYPPYALGLFAPFTLTSLHRAAQLYLAMKAMALTALIALWTRLLRASVLDPVWVLFLIFAYSSTIFVDFASGSITTVEQLFIWAGVAALLKGRYPVYVAAVVAASLLRLTPIVLLLPCLAAVRDRRGSRLVAGGVAAFAGVFLLTWALSPRLTVAFFHSVPKNYGERGWLNPALLPLVVDAMSFITRAIAAPLNRIVVLAAYAVAAGGIALPTAVMVRRVARSDAANRMEVIVYLVFLSTALVLPRFKNYSYMLLIVPTWYIATHSTAISRALPLLLLACLPVYSWITRPASLDLAANYSSWLIAFGAWSLYLYELYSGALLLPEAVPAAIEHRTAHAAAASR